MVVGKCGGLDQWERAKCAVLFGGEGTRRAVRETVRRMAFGPTAAALSGHQHSTNHTRRPTPKDNIPHRPWALGNSLEYYKSVYCYTTRLILLLLVQVLVSMTQT